MYSNRVKLPTPCVILVKPSVPKCWVEGGDVVGEALSLHCNVEKGSLPLRYSWTRISGGPFPAIATQGKHVLY